MHSFSILRDSQPRPLWQALAHLMANTPATDQRWDSLQRLFRALNPADKIRCQDELAQCRKAKRGELKAVVS